jgi:hypothetical protein
VFVVVFCCSPFCFRHYLYFILTLFCSVVLDPNGGALGAMITPFKLGLGGVCVSEDLPFTGFLVPLSPVGVSSVYFG